MNSAVKSIITSLLDARAMGQRFPEPEATNIHALARAIVLEVFGGDGRLVECLASPDSLFSDLWKLFAKHYGSFNFIFDTARKHGFSMGMENGLSSLKSFDEIEETLRSFIVCDYRTGVPGGTNNEHMILLRITNDHPDVVFFIIRSTGGSVSLEQLVDSDLLPVSTCYTLQELQRVESTAGSPIPLPDSVNAIDVLDTNACIDTLYRIKLSKNVRDYLRITGPVKMFLYPSRADNALILATTPLPDTDKQDTRGYGVSIREKGNAFFFSLGRELRNELSSAPGTRLLVAKNGDKKVFLRPRNPGESLFLSHLIGGTDSAPLGHNRETPVELGSEIPEATAYRATGGMAANALRALFSLPAIILDPSKALVSSRERIRREQGDLLITRGRQGNEVRDALGITATTTHVYLKKVKHATTGYPLLQLFPSRPSGTTSTEVALNDFRFVIPPDWLDDLSLVPGRKADTVVYKDEQGSTFAIITPAATSTYQTALLYPVPPVQAEKPRQRDTAIKNGKVWQYPPPTLAELEQDKRALFPADPATGKLLTDPATSKLLKRKEVDAYLAYKKEVITLIKNLCQQVTDACAANIDDVIQLFIDGEVSGSGTGVTGQVNQLLGNQSNLNQAVSLTLAGKAQVYLQEVLKLRGDTDRPDGKIKKQRKETASKKKLKKKKGEEKLVEYTADSVTSWFTARPAKWAEFVLFGTSPLAYGQLARQWKVSRTFTRNFLNGIRSRLDKHLPVELQLGQSLPPFTEQQIVAACQQLERELSQTVIDLAVAGKDTVPSLIFLSKVTTVKEQAPFLLDHLNGFDLSVDLSAEARAGLSAAQLAGLKLAPLITGWSPLKERSNAFATYILHQKNADYHGVLRAVLSLAVMDSSYPLAVTLQGLGVDAMTPERCLVKPFKSEKRNNNRGDLHYWNSNRAAKLQPIDLVMGSSKVVFRPGKGLVLTSLLQQNGVIEMQVPRHAGDRKPPVFYLPATPKMLHSIERGARVQLLRLHPPEGPSRKVKVDVVFYGPPCAFASTKHLALERFCPTCFANHPPGSTCNDGRCQKRAPVTVPEDTHLGIDINRVCKYMVAFSTGDPLSAESQLSLLTLDTVKHYDNAKNELSRQQQVLSKREKRLTGRLSDLVPGITLDRLDHLPSLLNTGMPLRPFKDFLDSLGINGKHRASLIALGYSILKINNQIDLLHSRIKKLRKGLHDLTTREIAVQLVLTGATTLACENLEGLDAYHKKGPLAIALQNMPRKLAVILRSVRNTNARYRELGIPLEVTIDPVDPRGTSTIHAGCGGTLDRSPGNWDITTCLKCGQTVNTHVSATLNIKFLSLGKPPVPPATPSGTVPPSSPPLPPAGIPPPIP
ncbi:MAG: hypothetical protein ACFFD4_19820 [Candidatus Odinarchaeota archaeon]